MGNKHAVVAAFCIYAQHCADAAKREVGDCALNSHGNYIVDHGKIMELCFGISVGTMSVYTVVMIYKPWHVISNNVVGNPNRKKMLIFGFVGIFEYIC